MRLGGRRLPWFVRPHLSPDHPLLLAAAVVVALGATFPVGRFFFGNRDQLIEEAEIPTDGFFRHWLYWLLWALGPVGGSAHFILATMWLVIILAAFAAGAYHVLVWLFA